VYAIFSVSPVVFIIFIRTFVYRYRGNPHRGGTSTHYPKEMYVRHDRRNVHQTTHAHNLSACSSHILFVYSGNPHRGGTSTHYPKEMLDMTRAAFIGLQIKGGGHARALPPKLEHMTSPSSKSTTPSAAAAAAAASKGLVPYKRKFVLVIKRRRSARRVTNHEEVMSTLRDLFPHNGV
jgi:hypothetical protein